MASSEMENTAKELADDLPEKEPFETVTPDDKSGKKRKGKMARCTCTRGRAIHCLKTTIFYLVYYSCLAAFFAGSLFIFLTTVDEHHPSQMGMNSLIKSNPGLSFRPMPYTHSTLIKFTQGEERSYRMHTDNIESFLMKYQDHSDNHVDCDPGSKPLEGKVCRFDPVQVLGNVCTRDNHYGYYDGQPCVLLKMNKVFGWEPEDFVNNTNPEDLDGHDVSPNGIYVTCMGENHSDADNLGEVEIFPKEGFLKNYFPYTNTPGYQSPLVFVRLRGLTPGVPVQVWCKAWAGNIFHDKNKKAGSTHFEILMD